MKEKEKKQKNKYLEKKCKKRKEEERIKKEIKASIVDNSKVMDEALSEEFT